MERRLVKRLGLFFSLLTFILFAINVFSIISDHGSIVGYEIHFTALLVSILFFISSFYPNGKYVQVGCICFTSIMTLIHDPNVGYSIAQLIIVAILSEKYGFLKKKLILKIGISFFILLLILSLVQNPRPVNSIVSTFLFFIIFAAFFYIITLDDIVIYLKNEKLLREKIKGLNVTLEEKNAFIDIMDTDYINPVEAGLTPAELELLKNLCTYRESNTDLAIRLTKSENTIKSQMKRILLKIGVESRYQLIDVCRNYYLVNES